jgi:DNA-binding LacI/PurR family transcriptional regulator
VRAQAPGGKQGDVSQVSFVSPATVPRVLNNIGVVKSSTRTRVLKAIEELKY